MIVPPVVLLIPLFVLFATSSLITTYRGVILIYAGLTIPFSVYLLTMFFRTMPHEILESAMADGASHFRILLQIVLPLSTPALVTLVVVNSLWVWNELLIALVFLPDDELKTLMVGITVFRAATTSTSRSPWPGCCSRPSPCCALPGRPAVLHPRAHRRRGQGMTALRDKHVIVTGAGRGIGEATARAVRGRGRRRAARRPHARAPGGDRRALRRRRQGVCARPTSARADQVRRRRGGGRRALGPHRRAHQQRRHRRRDAVPGDGRGELARGRRHQPHRLLPVGPARGPGDARTGGGAIVHNASIDASAATARSRATTPPRPACSVSTARWRWSSPSTASAPTASARASRTPT